MTLQELRERRKRVVAEARAISDQARRQNRDLTAEERRTSDALLERASGIKGDIEREEQLLEQERYLAGPATRAVLPDPDDSGPLGGRRFRDADGREIRALVHADKLSDYVAQRGSARPLPDGIRADEISPGRMILGLATGEWKGADVEHRAMGGVDLTAGGALLPEPVGARIIDMARNKMVVSMAGAVTVPMDSSRLTLASVDQDVTASWHSENQELTVSDSAFGGRLFVARTLAVLTPISIELIEDAANIGQLVEDSIAAAIALKLDLAALMGDSSANLEGVRQALGVQTIDKGVNGSVLNVYDDFSRAWQKVLEANGPQGRDLAVIYSPREAGYIDQRIDGNGQPLRPPPSWESIRKLVTNQIPTNLTKGTSTDASVAFLGNFAQVLIGMRTQLVIESSRLSSHSTAKQGFSSLSVLIRGYLRADINFGRADQLVVIDGITP